MRRTGLAVAVVTALTLFTANTFAQQEQGKARKQARQTHDQGVDDERAGAQRQAGPQPVPRSVAQAPVAVRSSGIAVAELDERFDEALVVTLNPDGTRQYVEVQGLDKAAAHVHAAPAPAQTPVLEEK